MGEARRLSAIPTRPEQQPVAELGRIIKPGTERRRRSMDETRRNPGDDGLSMIVTGLGLLATAVLTALLLSTMLDSGGTSGSGVSNEPGVAEATALQAQQTLTTGMTTADSAANNAGGYGSLQPSMLTASDPSITFVSGPSTNSDTLSMAVVAGGGDQSAGGSVAAAAGAIAGSAGGGGAGAGDGDGGVTGDGGGSITLADRSTDGTCWLAWKAAGGTTWYGAETGLASCTAPAISSTPLPGPVSSSSIGWKQGSFPDA